MEETRAREPPCPLFNAGDPAAGCTSGIDIAIGPEMSRAQTVIRLSGLSNQLMKIKTAVKRDGVGMHHCSVACDTLNQVHFVRPCAYVLSQIFGVDRLSSSARRAENMIPTNMFGPKPCITALQSR